jgi:uncharacterized protein YndB with AHSA1/START domain
MSGHHGVAFLAFAFGEDFAIMSSRIAARASHHFKVAADRVYDAWLDPEKVRVWMTASLMHEMDAQWADYVSRTESGWTRILDAIDRFLT